MYMYNFILGSEWPRTTVLSWLQYFLWRKNRFDLPGVECVQDSPKVIMLSFSIVELEFEDQIWEETKLDWHFNQLIVLIEPKTNS